MGDLARPRVARIMTIRPRPEKRDEL
jgi:hypothetical protein